MEAATGAEEAGTGAEEAATGAEEAATGAEEAATGAEEAASCAEEAATGAVEAATGAEEAATGAEEAATGAEEAATGAEEATSAEAAMDKPARPPDRLNEQFAVTSAVFVQEPKGPAELKEPEEPVQPDEPKEPAELKEPEVPGEPGEPKGPAELKEPEVPGEPKEPTELKKPEEPEEDPGWDEWPPDGNNRPLSSRKDRPRRHGTENVAEEDAATALLEEEARENCEPEPRRIVLTPENRPWKVDPRHPREASSRGRAAEDAESTKGWYGCRSGHRRSTEGS